ALPAPVRGSQARWHRPALRRGRARAHARARAPGRVAGTARRVSGGRSAIRAADNCRPAWSEIACSGSRETGRRASEALWVDPAAALNIAPGEVAWREVHVLGEPVVPRAARVGRRDELLDDRPARRLERRQRLAHLGMLAQHL